MILFIDLKTACKIKILYIKVIKQFVEKTLGTYISSKLVSQNNVLIPADFEIQRFNCISQIRYLTFFKNNKNYDQYSIKIWWKHFFKTNKSHTYASFQSDMNEIRVWRLANVTCSKLPARKSNTCKLLQIRWIHLKHSPLLGI